MLRVDLGPVESIPRAAAPVRIPVVLSVEEVRQVLAQMHGTSLPVASLLYGAGLRLQESLELRINGAARQGAERSAHDVG